MKAAVARQLDRRGFIKSAGAGAAAAATLGFTSDADLEAAVQNVNPRSIPSELKITDLLHDKERLTQWMHTVPDFEPYESGSEQKVKKVPKV